METRYNRLPVEEEIDFTSLLRNIFLFLKRRFKILVIFFVLGLILGVAMYYFLPRTYKSRLIADSGTLPNADVINIIESWQNLVLKGDFQRLALTLNMDYAQASKIRGIEAFNTLKDNQPLQSNEEKQNSFIIEIVVSDPNILTDFQGHLISALENNEFIKKRVAIKKENFLALKQKILGEITDLEGVKSSVQQLLKNGSSTASTFLSDPANINLQIVSLYERVLTIDASIRLLDDIQVIEPFTVSSKPDNPKVVVCLGIGMALGIFAFFIYTFIQFIKQ